MDNITELKWASEEDRKKAEADMFLYGNAINKNIDGILHHVPLEDFYSDNET